jgi:hypothetical protein
MRRVVAALAAAVLLAGCGANSGSNVSGSAPTASAPVSAAPSEPASNGVAALEPDAIVEKAKAALTEAKSFRVNGNVREDNQSFGVDFKIRGADLIGAMTIGKAKVEVLRVGKQQFIRPNQAFWKMSAGSAKQAETIMTVLNGRWVKVSAKDKDFTELFSVTDVDKLLDPDGRVVKGEIQTVDGKQAIALKDSGSEPGTLFVATEGKPYPLRIDGPTPADGGIRFSDFGATFTDLTAPPATQVIDLAKLAG